MIIEPEIEDHSQTPAIGVLHLKKTPFQRSIISEVWGHILDIYLRAYRMGCLQPWPGGRMLARILYKIDESKHRV
jgi:hypothetical protein